MRTLREISENQMFIQLAEAQDLMQGRTFTDIDLQEQAFTGLETHADLKTACFDNCQFTDSHFKGSIRHSALIGCTFTRCHFFDAEWTDFINCTFTDCTFERTVANCVFKQSRMNNTTFKLELQKATFEKCHIHEGGLYYPEGCTFTNCQFSDAELMRVTYSTFKGCDFVSCVVEEQVEDTAFDGCRFFDMALPDCEGCLFKNTQATDCSWQDTDFVKVQGISRIYHNGSAYLIFHGSPVQVLTTEEAPLHIEAIITLLGA